MSFPRQEWVARKCLPGLISLVVAFVIFSEDVVAQEIEGTWFGVMVLDGQQGSMTLTIRRQGQAYAADYQGLPSFSGPLLSVRAGPGQVVGTTTFSAVSKSTPLSIGNDARLRFYLSKDNSKPQLYGVVRMDRDLGEDLDFKVVLEKPPCCHSGCILRKECP